jgi:lipopolysaccharide transport system permease protein
MITKIYFPRIILPLSSVLAGLADFAIAFLVLIGMMIFYKIPVTPRVWFLPLFLFLTVLTSLGVGLWLSAMNVLYRDINYITPFLTQFWWVVTPIAYSTSIFTGRWSSVLALNPMTGVIEGFRWSLLNTTQPLSIPTILVSALISLVVLVTGILYFRRMERLFADMV